MRSSTLALGLAAMIAADGCGGNAKPPMTAEEADEIMDLATRIDFRNNEPDHCPDGEIVMRDTGSRALLCVGAPRCSEEHVIRNPFTQELACADRPPCPDRQIVMGDPGSNKLLCADVPPCLQKHVIRHPVTQQLACAYDPYERVKEQCKNIGDKLGITLTPKVFNGELKCGDAEGHFYNNYTGRRPDDVPHTGIPAAPSID